MVSSVIKKASFNSFDWQNNTISLNYSYDDRYQLVCQFKVDGNYSKPDNWPTYVFHLGLAYFPYIFAPANPATVIIKAGYLPAAAVKTWQQWYRLGLGEFFYKNNAPCD